MKTTLKKGKPAPRIKCGTGHPPKIMSKGCAMRSAADYKRKPRFQHQHLADQ